ncbi:MAG: VacJ family lipoprotein [Woeseiaceae bacterium]|nr:VacJ family lipoprotein [Woeseiaceae bacterium]
MPDSLKRVPAAALLLAALVLSGCVSPGTPAPPDERSAADPWEPLNRGIYSFNRTVDNATLKPVARGYRAVVPGLARRGVSNFFDNLITPRTAVNNFLQGKPGDGLTDVARFLMNSTVGLGGLLDIGMEFGLEEHDEDFGQTLAVWGVGDGPYVMLPFLGPRTLRDAIVLPVDWLGDPLYHYDNTSAKDKLVVLDIIDMRYRLLSAERFLEDSETPYITLRESYLQNRNYNVHDGNPPMDDDFYDDLLDESE